MALEPCDFDVASAAESAKPPRGDPLASSGGDAQKRGKPWNPSRQALETPWRGLGGSPTPADLGNRGRPPAAEC